MRILGIESSCDETAFCLLKISGSKIEVERNLVSSQIDIHSRYGGVVPEVAARQHTEVIIPLLQETWGRKYRPQDIDLLAVTQGPGLITSLLIGLQTAQTLSYVWQKPLLGVNHLAGHLYSSWLESDELNAKSKNIFPALGLLVSGGHTELVLIRDYDSYKLIGHTRDDAAGEAFDKVAKILGMGYPGGPAIAEAAAEGNPSEINFPRPMLNSKNFDFSFSGLKTAVRYYVSEHRLRERQINNVCASFQQAAVDVLVEKSKRAIDKYQVKSLLLGGGVAANKKLRKELLIMADRQGVQFYCPRMKYTGDNAAMIALAAYFRWRHLSIKQRKDLLTNWYRLEPKPNWDL
ncbi:MAG: tRNA (adenosine(37)-N6)-threonylcarbamoyltransferase complex transferase subunit TsaD [Candidatus Komeilibacteria bacterium]